MSRRMCIVGIFVIIISLSSCTKYDGEYPFDYGPAKWVSNDPKFEFWIDSDTGIFPKGIFYVDGTEFPFVLSFGYSNYATFSNDMGYPLLEGECVFSPDKLSVSVSFDKIFNNQFEEINFYRTVE